MESPEPTEFRLEVLKGYLERSEQSVRTFDDHLYKIKGFAVTVSSAVNLFRTSAEGSRTIARCSPSSRGVLGHGRQYQAHSTTVH